MQTTQTNERDIGEHTLFKSLVVLSAHMKAADNATLTLTLPLSVLCLKEILSTATPIRGKIKQIWDPLRIELESTSNFEGSILTTLEIT